VEQRRGVIPRRVMARLCRVRALNARTRVREQVCSWGTLERGGARSRGHEPSSEVDLARGGALLGRSGGPRGPPRCGLCCVCMFCVRFEVCLRFAFVAGFKQDSPPRFF
jgi:hypothetical protein